MPAPARDAAFRVLGAITTGRVDLGDALSRARDPLTDSRDRALATDLATGTLRWRSALDYQLQRLSAKPLQKLDQAVLDALRLGAYQILYLDRVPISAVVNDSVDLVKASGLGSAAGFANAVLRRLARERNTLTWPDRSDLVAHLSVLQSHPAWLVRRWLDRHGEHATEQWLRFNNEPPAMTLASNRLLGTRDELIARLRSEGVEAVPTLRAPFGLTVTSGRPLASAAFRDGYCLVQDEASQIIPELLQAKPEQRVLDACASPGGKTLAAAAQCAPAGHVVATDVRRRRVQLLAATVTRCRATNVHVVQIGARSPLPFADEAFDRVLIDAPCSGLGTVRRDPDIRWRRDPSQFETLARTQADLLARVRSLVARGGRLVYSTCSSEPEENEDVVAAFLEMAPEFSVLSLASAGLAASISAMQTDDGYLRTSPAFGLEAFFAAILQKQG
ncbi:MAG TPA: 16S rRNA (cytosine(967)-C(5))-methyltransferase RsmB [Vicinamibacterales bacterium]|nr:16S rRNA (cytosine(967)-C(5))-methyltransferase RsmB [Vicinamibacterales bacterium]